MHVSFRNRLTFFFIVLVILPVIAVAAVGILIVHDSENSKNATSLNRARVAAEALYDDAQRPRDGGRGRPSRPTTGSPWRSATATAPPSRIGSRPSPSGPARSGYASCSTVKSRSRRARARRSRLRAAGWSTRTASPRGELDLSVTRPDEFANLLERVTGFDVVLSQDGEFGRRQPGGRAG